MSRIAEMHSLTEDLMRSHQERMADLAVRQREVGSSLRETHAARSAMADAQREMLEVGRAALQADVSATIGGFHAARVAGEAARKADRIQVVSDLMDAFHQAQAEMAAEQREALEQVRPQLMAETAGFLGEIHAARVAGEAARKADRIQGVSDLMDAFHQARAEMAAEQRETFAGYRADRKALAEDLAEFSQVWRDFCIAMQGRPTSVPPGPPPLKVEVKPVPPPRPVEPGIAAETREAPSGEAVFGYLADHPDGARLVELEAHFGTSRIRLVTIVTRLIEENKARKDESLKLYFAS